jgi:hypothetical protein
MCLAGVFFITSIETTDVIAVIWVPKKDLWCKAWRPDATFQTNDLIESYHNSSMSYYLGRSRGQNHRVDRLIYSLGQLVEPDYRQEILQIFYDFK